MQTTDAPSPLNEHRERLRVTALELLDAVQTAPKPQSLTEIGRLARLVMVIDRMLCQVYKDPARPARTPKAQAKPAPAIAPYIADKIAPKAKTKQTEAPSHLPGLPFAPPKTNRASISAFTLPAQTAFATG